MLYYAFSIYHDFVVLVSHKNILHTIYAELKQTLMMEIMMT